MNNETKFVLSYVKSSGQKKKKTTGKKLFCRFKN